MGHRPILLGETLVSPLIAGKFRFSKGDKQIMIMRDNCPERREVLAQFGSAFVGPYQLCELINQLEAKLMECWSDYWDGGLDGEGPMPEGATSQKWLGTFRCEYRYIDGETFGDFFSILGRDNHGYIRKVMITYDHLRDVEGFQVVNVTIDSGRVPDLGI